MNYLRTAVLLAGLTALFMAVGFLIGGGEGAVIALVFAALTNLFSYWNSDKLVLRMHNAQQVDERSAPELVAIVRELSQRAGLPMPRVYLWTVRKRMRSPPDGIRDTLLSALRPGSLTGSAGKKSLPLSVTSSAMSRITIR